METKILTTPQKNGQKYSYRQNRLNIFSPPEWDRFFLTLKNNQKPIFETLLQTGARIMEALNIQVRDFDFENNTLKINTVKQRACYSNGRKREIRISTQYARKIKSFIEWEKLGHEDYPFLIGVELPWNYSSLPNPEKKKYYEVRKVSLSALFKRKLKKAGIDEKKYSLHNIRKTSESWLCFLNINHLIILQRFGHNQSTALNHYISKDIPDEKYKYKARALLGDLYS